MRMGDGIVREKTEARGSAKSKSKKPDTMHTKILNDIKKKIVSGEWRPGHKIPYELTLAKNYSVSRMTANKVLTELTRQGFLERRRRLGTLVCLPNAQSAVLQIYDIESEVKDLKLDYSYELIERSIHKPKKRELAAFQADLGDTQLLELSCLHYADDAPFCFEERLINLAAVPSAATTNFKVETPSKWLLKTVPWSSAVHTISARGADTELAKRLAIKPGAACLVVERRTENEGKPVTFARLTYPGDRHEMVARFKPVMG